MHLSLQQIYPVNRQINFWSQNFTNLGAVSLLSPVLDLTYETSCSWWSCIIYSFWYQSLFQNRVIYIHIFYLQFPSETQKSSSMRLHAERIYHNHKESEQTLSKSKSFLKSLLTRHRSRKDEMLYSYLDEYWYRPCSCWQECDGQRSYWESFECVIVYSSYHCLYNLPSFILPPACVGNFVL